VVIAVGWAVVDHWNRSVAEYPEIAEGAQLIWEDIFG
jgi:hypothetical protein